MTMRLRTAFISTFVRQIFVMGLGVVSISMISKLLGAADFGRYAIAVAVAGVGQAIFSFSAPPVIVHFFSKVKDRATLVGDGITIFACALSLFVVFSGLAFYSGWLDAWGIDVSGWAVVLLLMTLQVINSIFEAIFLGSRNYRMFNLLQVCVPCVLMALVLIFLDSGDGWKKALLLSCVAAMVATPMYVIFSLRTFGAVKLGISAGVSETYFNYGLTIWSANLITMALYRTPLFIVEHMCNARSLGVFALANNFSEKIWIPGKAVATILFPERSSSGMDGGVKRSGVYKIVAGNMFLSLIGMLALCLVFYFFGSVFFGSGFEGVHRVVLALVPGIVSWSGVTILGAELAGLGLSRANFNVSLLAFVVSLIACVLGAQFGAEGVALGASLGYMVGLVFSFVSYHKASAELLK